MALPPSTISPQVTPPSTNQPSNQTTPTTSFNDALNANSPAANTGNNQSSSDLHNLFISGLASTFGGQILDLTDTQSDEDPAAQAIENIGDPGNQTPG